MAALGALTDRLTRQLNAIVVYRQAIISAAVTGQIDVALVPGADGPVGKGRDGSQANASQPHVE